MLMSWRQQGAKTSTTMIFTMLNRINSVPAREGLGLHTHPRGDVGSKFKCVISNKISDWCVKNISWNCTQVGPIGARWWWVNIYSGNTVWCRCNAVNCRKKNQQNTPHSSPVRVRYGVCFEDPASDWYSASVHAITNAVSYYIGPR